MKKLYLGAAATLLFAVSAPAQQQPVHKNDNLSFFVTSGVGRSADLGGLSGADQVCQSLAQAAGAGSKTWRAYLSTPGAGGATAGKARDRTGRGPRENNQ